jgi:hypothetical protein
MKDFWSHDSLPTSDGGERWCDVCMEVIGDRGAAALQARGDGLVTAFHRMKVLNASGARLLAAHDNVRSPLDERSEIDPT